MRTVTRLVWALTGLLACGTATSRDEFDDDAGQGDDAAQAGPAADSGPGIQSEGGREASTTDPSAIDLDAVAPCDDDLAIDGDAAAFAKALGLCQRASESGPEWGLIEIDFRHHIGTNVEAPADFQHGILPRFGSVLVPREGQRLGVLSTGYAREYDDDTAQHPFDEGKGSGLGVGEVPDEFGGFDADAYDLVNVRMRIRVPSNAHGLSFDFDFHTGEWPSYVRSEYNDRFIVWLTDAAHPNGTNISFDSQNRPVTVNLGFFDRCVDDVPTGCAAEDSDIRQSDCPAGPGELAGTGFDLRNDGCGGPPGDVTRGGATGWLTTKTKVTPGEIITLEFAIWDEFDANRDSLVLLDHLRWEADDVTPGTTRPPS